MTNSNNLEKIAAHNQRSLKTLTRAIAMGKGKFSLMIVRCNYEHLQGEIFQLLRQNSSGEIEDFLVPKSATSLYTAIKEHLGDKSPDALIVLGLELVKHLDSILQSANILRDKFRSFPFPIVLWLTDFGLKKLMQHAPDFNSYASAPISFSLPDEELAALICQRLDAAVNDADNFQIKRAEIDGLRQDLAGRDSDLEAETRACFAFLVGWDLARNKQIDAAVEKYRECLEFWQDDNQILRRGIVQLFLAQAYPKRAEARDYFQECFQSFSQANRLDLKAKHIRKLALLLQQLKEWAALAELVTNEALPLHLKYGGFLAEDYGFLAVAAVQQSKWQEAAANAKLALEALKKENNARYFSLYLLILFLAKTQLDRVENALEKLTEANDYLEAAREAGLSEDDARLLVEIIEKLQKALFEKRQYLAAFNCKLTVRKIQSQYGWIAFIGAARLQPSLKVINAEEKTAEEKGKNRQEIMAASGRQPDLERLIERMKNTDKKLTVIYGNSGVGKSSLLQAGLVPLMELDNFDERDYLPVLLWRYQNWDGELIEKLNNQCKSLQDCREWLGQNQRFYTLLIFDQFEEFFFDNPDAKTRQEFYQFLRECLEIPYLKVVFSLREDYLHYFFEPLRGYVSSKIDTGYEDIFYYLGDLNPEDARAIIESLTARSPVRLEPDLISQLVSDLTGELGGVRPIELQIVGSKLETDKITSLRAYQELGENPKEILVERFLEDAVKDCGEENQRAAELVLYWLTNDKNTRPLKTARELKEALEIEAEKLDLVLEVLVGSGLVLQLPETPEDFYQLVHDYLVSFVRQRQSAKLVSQLRTAKAELNRVLKRQLQAARYGIAVLVVLLFAVGGFWFLAETQRRRAEIAEIEALNIGAEALFSSNQQLDALLAAVKAGKKLNQISAPEELREETKRQLAEVLRNIQERNRLEEHTNQVLAVNFSPDGKLLVSSSYDDTVKLWSSNGTLLETLEGHKDDVMDAIFSPNGNRIASASRDGTIKLWNREGKELKELLGLTSAIVEVSFSPDSLTLAFGSYDKTVKLWNLSDRTLPEELGKHDKWVTSLSFSPNGELASASCDGTIKLWNPNGELTKDFPAHTKCVRRVRFSRNGEFLASGSDDNTVKLWSRDGSLLKILEGHSDRVSSVAFSPDGRTLASAAVDGTIFLWHRNGTRIDTLPVHAEAIYDLSFSGDGTIASAVKDTTVRLWQYENSLLKSFPEPGKPKKETEKILDVHISSNGQQLVLLASGDVLELWTMDGSLERTFPEKLEPPKTGPGASFAPDGQTFASFNEKQIKLWRVDGSLPQTLPTASDTVINVTFSPDGQFLAALLKDGNIDLWSLDDLSRRVIPTGDGNLSTANFSPDAKSLVSATRNGNIKIWRLSDMELLKSFPAHEQTIYQAKFSPNGQAIATASEDNTVKLWTLDGTEIATLKGHEGRVWDVAFSPDSSIIASVSADNTIKLWSVDNGMELQSIQEEILQYGGGIKFTLDGQQLVAAGVQTANLWELELDKLESLAETFNNVNALLESSCDWLKDYLRTNSNLSESDKSICDEF